MQKSIRECPTHGENLRLYKGELICPFLWIPPGHQRPVECEYTEPAPPDMLMRAQGAPMLIPDEA